MGNRRATGKTYWRHVCKLKAFVTDYAFEHRYAFYSESIILSLDCSPLCKETFIVVRSDDYIFFVFV